MKANINDDGELVILAETSVEAYALKHWRESRGVLKVDCWDTQVVDYGADEEEVFVKQESGGCDE